MQLTSTEFTWLNKNNTLQDRFICKFCKNQARSVTSLHLDDPIVIKGRMWCGYLKCVAYDKNHEVSSSEPETWQEFFEPVPKYQEILNTVYGGILKQLPLEESKMGRLDQLLLLKELAQRLANTEKELKDITVRKTLLEQVREEAELEIKKVYQSLFLETPPLNNSNNTEDILL